MGVFGFPNEMSLETYVLIPSCFLSSAKKITMDKYNVWTPYLKITSFVQYTFYTLLKLFFLLENQPTMGPRGRNVISFSLQGSPTRTMMDPIDFNNLASSRYNSTENLFNSLPPESNGGLSSKWRSSRRSLRSRSPDFSREELYESIEAESERLLDEREIELRKRLQGFEEGNTK